MERIAESQAFSERLRKALEAAGVRPSPTLVANEFNLRHWGRSITPHTARNWLLGQALPTQDKLVVLGLVTTKFGAMETKDSLKRRIDEAAKYAPLSQLALSPQCGFSSTVHGNNIAVEDQRSKLRLVVETAQEVWG